MPRRAPERRSLHDFETWRCEVRTIDDLVALSTVEYRIRTADEQFARAAAARVTPSAFRMVRVEALLGRTLLESDAGLGAPRVVVIGYGLWHRLYDGDPNVIGRDVRLGRAASTIISVMLEGFGFPMNQELWVVFAERVVSYPRWVAPAPRARRR